MIYRLIALTSGDHVALVSASHNLTHLYLGKGPGNWSDQAVLDTGELLHISAGLLQCMSTAQVQKAKDFTVTLPTEVRVAIACIGQRGEGLLLSVNPKDDGILDVRFVREGTETALVRLSVNEAAWTANEFRSAAKSARLN
ncbi:hypothetical protein EZI54_03850 [Marinobacter halodurans]|uniref:Uncharacterized protein n=1 Tax=Marinobacter halodurans TaxID=2528979 RepID=A0ABY1ZR57_9GAMM|nr:hypothetical protein [Marinobacter halodurans]TBW58527.1 hypothetical protein EZI54_03850 [Marinobacter halodurans]